MQALSLTFAFARSSFLTMLAHRLRYVIGVINYLVYVAVQWYLWSAVFQGRNEVATWSLAQMQTYVCINWIARSTYFSNSDSQLAGRISKGEIASDLLRPTSLLMQYYGSAWGEMAFRALFMSLPVALIVVYAFGLEPPANAAALAGFCVSMVLAFHIFFAINFLVGLCAVLTEKLQGFLWAKFILMQFLSGHLLPYEFFPAGVKAVFDWLPFSGIAYTPMNLYLGRWTGEQALNALALQFAWTAILMFGCEWGWRAVRRRLCSLGG